jgi:hypothetical protein
MDEKKKKNGWTLFWMLPTNVILEKFEQKK